jgi:outer membrane protein TolC/ABC-type uncharacterized transport system substrate-binding protein
MYDAQARPFNIGVIEDCSAKIATEALLPEIKAEVKSLTRSEFDVRFPKEKHIVAQCTPESIQAGIEQLMKDPDLDLVMALGHLGSYYLCKRSRLPKPAIAGVILSTDLHGVPFKKGCSGKKNLTYIAFSTDIKKSLNRLKEITPFETAAYLYDRDIEAILPQKRLSPQELTELLGTKIEFIPVGRDTDASLAELDNRFDAVFVGNLQQLGDTAVDNIINHLKKKKLPGFSFYGKGLVPKGLLAGFDQSTAEKKYIRRLGLLVQRILLGDALAEIPVLFSKETHLLINMQTARKIGVSPSFAILAKAEVIHRETAITPAGEMLLAPPKPGKETIKPIPISPTVSQDTIREEQNIFKKAQTSGERMTLLDAVHLTLEKNPGLMAKRKEVAAGEMNVKEALSKLYPQLTSDLTGRAIDEDRSSGLTGTAERAWDITAQVSQIIYSDRLYTNFKTSRHYQKALALSENQDRLDGVLDTGIAYLNVLKTRANARIQLENLGLIRNHLTLANNRYKAGFSGPSDVYRLESKAASAYHEYLEAQAKVGASKIHLHQLLDLELEKETAMTDIGLNDGLFVVSNPQARKMLNVKSPDTFKAFRDFFVKKGLEHSPELASIGEQILAQEAVYQYAKRSYWSPDVSLFGSAGNTFEKSGKGSDFHPSDLPPDLIPVFDAPSDSYWTVGVNITLPLYEGGAKSALKIRALNTTRQLTWYKKQITNLISENIRIALMDIGASFPAIELTGLSAGSAQKNLYLVVDAYTKGAVSIVDLLDAQNAFLNTKILAENAVYDFFMDFLIAERAAGRFSLLMDANKKEGWLMELNEKRH